MDAVNLHGTSLATNSTDRRWGRAGLGDWTAGRQQLQHGLSVCISLALHNQFLRLNHTTLTTSRPNAAPEELEVRDSEPGQRDNNGTEENADGPVRRLSGDLSSDKEADVIGVQENCRV